jgi:hypothetical protein
MDFVQIAATTATWISPFLPYLLEPLKAGGNKFGDFLAENGGKIAWETALGVKANHIDLSHRCITSEKSQSKFILSETEHIQLNACHIGFIPTFIEGQRIPQAVRKFGLTSD